MILPRMIRRRAAIQALVFLMLALWFGSACTAEPTTPATLIPSDPPTASLSPSASLPLTSTSTLTASPTLTATATNTPAPTPTPSITPTPTKDFSFYDITDCLPKDTPYQRGLVTRVLDGDSVEVQLADGITNTVRYIGIDTPETGFPFYEDAFNGNADLVLHKEIVLVTDRSDVDAYGRWLRYVFVDDMFVNLELVRAGLASAANYPPDEACKGVFITAQQEAQQAMVGMWAPTPTLQPSTAQVVILAVDKRQEWVDLQNTGAGEVDLAGWNLVSERGNQECPLSGVIKAGDTLRIWAMAAQGEGFSCGYSSPIWNNSEPDPAVLYNAQGVEVSRM